MKFHGLDLNLLLALDRLFKDRSVSVAAKSLHLSPSALSHALNRLRDYFDDALLVPSGRKLILTPLAETLVEPLREALVQIESVVSHTRRFDPANSQRHFTFLASDYSITVCLAEAVSRARRLAPGFTFQFAYPNDPIGCLDRGDVDLIVLPLQNLAPEHPRAPLFEDRYVVAVWSGGALAGEQIDTERYFELGHVEARFELGRHAESNEGRTLAAPRQRRVVVTTPSFSTVPQMLVGSDLIATMPARLAHVAACHLPITIKSLPFESPVIHEQIQWSMHRNSDPAIGWLVELIQGVCDPRQS